MSKKLKKNYRLSNGIEVRTSTRTAGYKGVSYYGASEEKPFIAFLDKPLIEDFGLEELVDHSRSTMIHLGWFSDVREAALVAAMGYQDKDGMEYMLSFHQVSGNGDNGSGELFDDFPSDLDILPETMTASQAWAKSSKSKNQSMKKKAVKAVMSADAKATKSNKEVADRRAAYEATLPEWLRR